MSAKKRPTKLTQDDIATLAAEKADISVSDMKRYMAAIESVMKDAAFSGAMVYIKHFGIFYVQRHKEHPVQFTPEKLSSYLVYKFSAAKIFNEELRNVDKFSPIDAIGHRPSR